MVKQQSGCGKKRKEKQQSGSFASRFGFVTTLERVYRMVDDPSTDSIISWSESGKSFIVWDPTEFSRDFLQRTFHHNKFSSFIDRLDFYGIKKVESSEHCEFADEDFVKGEPERVMKIYARGSDSDDDSDDEVTVLMNSESKVVTITKTVSMKKTTKNKKTIMKKKKAIADELQVLQI
ncbi:hypothetical protein Rs2_38132 [Raphanus sativus]|uniref:Heat stress transcription factor A-4a n=1 Tax=Raphanus sativus TaxID=3726 RepID=A0A6J0KPL6_RAPSA|nr:heat stress transcription factor A-4a [Raphanus sativus]KAJ4881077.1 hypothetical protein Rs2_38132 [Raphanus sativus]